ncbi:IPTL-CTERM sorting domain-containing protein [Pseudomonadota bacterium]
MAQQSCPADIFVEIDSPGDTFAIGQTIPIRVEFRMGEAPVLETVTISGFQYLLDCEGTDTFLGCLAQGGIEGNVVNFIEGSEETNCPVSGTPNGVADGTLAPPIRVDFDFIDDNGNGILTDVVLDSTPVTPDGNTFNSCYVTFDVVVEELSDTLVTKEVIEWAAVSGLQAQCGDLPAGSAETLSFNISNPNTVIWVTKDFTDNNKSEVDVHLRCDAGTVVNPDFTQLSDPAANGTFDKVGFIVYNIPSEGANCTVFEDPVPSGYAATYLAGVRNAAEGDYEDYGELDDNEGCFFTAVKGGEYTCEVTNTGKPAEFTVYKEWLVDGAGGQEVVEEAHVTITCNSEIFENPLDEDSDENEVEGVVVPPLLPSGDWKMIGTLGDDEFMTAKVDTSVSGARCSATEKVESSGVEAVDTCRPRTLGPGGSSSCKFINTVFFEGIPTLNQYGMALMMLLMLGLGALTFRRFA